MPAPTLADVLAVVVDIRATLNFTLSKVLIMANDVATLSAAVAALNTATSAEAALLTGLVATINGDDAKLDAVQAKLDALRNSPGIPQSVMDQLAAISTTVGGVSDSLTATQTKATAQAARLDSMAQDPSNPVPAQPPAG